VAAGGTFVRLQVAKGQNSRDATARAEGWQHLMAFFARHLLADDATTVAGDDVS
jgi:hypothetical protein